MKSLSSVGIGLTVLFTFLFLALIAELYYLLWWKKRLTINNRPEIESHDYTNPAKYLFHMFCLRNHSPLNPQLQICSSTTTTTSTHLQNDNAPSQNDDFLFKPFGDQSHYYPPRFLFTIVEETKEELESEDGKSCKSRNRSLSDLLVTLETPYLTPLASPPFFTPPLTPGGFNFLFDSASEAESNKMRSFSSSPSPSPPSKFRFLREAEEKMTRKKKDDDHDDHDDDDEEEESFITITVDHKNNKQYNNSSSYSQALPLSSSPSTFTR